jgi:hypothetical protein
MTGRSEPAAAMNFDRTASCGLPTTMHPPYHFIGWREGQPATYGEHHRVRNRLAADGRHCCSPCTRVQHSYYPGNSKHWVSIALDRVVRLKKATTGGLAASHAASEWKPGMITGP